MSFQTTWKNTWLLYWESTWFSSIVSDSRAQVLTDKQVIFLMKHSNTYQKFSKMINLNLWKRTVFIHRITWTVSKFDERLPEKKIFFYNILQDENISDEQYNHAKNLWNTFNLNTMGEYHDLYLKSDILMLADLFHYFKKTCLQYYKLDPCHYFPSPGLSWDAMLKMTYQIGSYDWHWYVSIHWKKNGRWYLKYCQKICKNNKYMNSHNA